MEEPKKKGKEARVWALQGGKKDTEVLDYSSKETPQEHENGKENSEDNKLVVWLLINSINYLILSGNGRDLRRP